MTKTQNIYFMAAVTLCLGGSTALRHLGYAGFAGGLTGVFIVFLHRINRVTGAYARWSPFWVRIMSGAVIVLSTIFALGFLYDIYKLFQ